MKQLLTILYLLSILLHAEQGPKERYFTKVNTTSDNMVFDIRYATHHNFIGKPIEGYNAPLCYLSKQSAASLLQVQNELENRGLTLHIYDCYRPQRAVDHFVRWAKNLTDVKMKEEFYPHVAKKALFRDGYIAAKSGHSRGSTLDLSIHGLDMGTPFDFFDPRSHTASKSITSKQHKNRMLLKEVMERHGFKNYADEWWHYTLKDEPFQTTYFDFQVQ